MACRVVGATHYLSQCCDIPYLTRRNTFQLDINRNPYIFIQDNVFENVACEMLDILLGLNMFQMTDDDAAYLKIILC